MICPECKAEYKPGFTECPDCGVHLVDELPSPEPLTPEEEEAASLVEVFSTFNQAHLLLARSFLDAQGIAYHVRGELFGGSGVFITPAAILVARGNAPKVRGLLRDNGIE